MERKRFDTKRTKNTKRVQRSEGCAPREAHKSSLDASSFVFFVHFVFHSLFEPLSWLPVSPI